MKGSKRYAVLEFTDLEQRILARNKIEDRVQEDLVKWYEEYNAAQVDLNPASRYTVPKPTKNPYWENFKLSFAKYFRGDDRKILKWGLDLSGGKTVRIGLRDQNAKRLLHRMTSSRPQTNYITASINGRLRKNDSCRKYDSSSRLPRLAGNLCIRADQSVGDVLPHR